MHPFKVVGEKKKRIRATWTQVRELEQTIKEQQEIIDKMKDLLERQSSALEKAHIHLNEVRDENLALRLENERLHGRSFIERLFNK